MNIIETTTYEYSKQIIDFMDELIKEEDKKGIKTENLSVTKAFICVKENGFLFDNFKLRLIGTDFIFKVEVDHDVVYVREIDTKEGKCNKVLFTLDEWGATDIKSDEGNKTMANNIIVPLILCITIKAMNQEVVQIEETNRKYTKSSSKKTTAKKDTVYSLDQCVRKYARHINHCKHVIACEHWEVRGHFRHYKNGKTVYVKPFEKGKNKNAGIKDKVYKI